MTDLRHLREIEKLVQDSVFHASPCRRLRERVLESAVQAKHRQNLWKRFVVASSAVMGSLVIAFVVIRLSAPGSTVATEPGPVRVQIYSPGHSVGLAAAPQKAAASNSSLGEDFYFRQAAGHGESSQRLPAPTTGVDQSNLSTGKDLGAKSE